MLPFLRVPWFPRSTATIVPIVEHNLVDDEESIQTSVTSTATIRYNPKTSQIHVRRKAIVTVSLVAVICKSQQVCPYN